MAERRILRIGGSEAESFLQGLITNDINRLTDGLVYAALLTPQGKYIADFFLCRQDDAILLDIAAELSDAFVKRLTLYKLRADVTIAQTDLAVHRGTGPAPDGALTDPRHPALGWRRYASGPATDDGTDWDALRVTFAVPETGVELGPETYILEAGFEALNGVDFRKGCYVGQEVTARMKHKTELRKGLRIVEIDGTAPVGSEITTAEGKPVGTLYSQSGGRAIAYLRLDRAKGEMRSGAAVIRLNA